MVARDDAGCRQPGVPGRRSELWLRLLRSPGVWGIVLVTTVAWMLVRETELLYFGDSLLEQFGPSAVVLLVLVHAIVSVSPFPGEVIAVHNSMLLGLVLGTCCNWCGWMLGSAIQYGLAKRAMLDVGGGGVRSLENLPAWLRRLPVEHPLFLICGRWIPFGGHVVNTSAGAFSVGWRRYLLCTAISVVPIALLFAAVGHGWATWARGG